MKQNQIATFRLFTQHISHQHLTTLKDLMCYMGAMQAQDFAMTRWATGLRLPGLTDQQFLQEYNKGNIIRTHLLRPTWHLVSAEDIHWMLDLTAPQIKTFMRSNNKLLGLTSDILLKSQKLLIKALRDHHHLTREKLIPLYQKANIPINENRLSHLLMDAELDGHICSGRIKHNKLTYALMPERVPNKKIHPREEALALLANRYFKSHAPATLKDFTWWSGLGIKDARSALEMIKPQLISASILNETYYFPDIKLPTSKKKSVSLLPSFDEYLISYKDRAAALHADHHRKLISINGIFWPCILLNGQVIGSWKRTMKGGHVSIDASLFTNQESSIKKLIESQATKYRKFLHAESCTVKWNE